MRRVLAVLLLAATGCGGGSKVESEPETAALPCNVETVGAEAWKLVETEDFTFCVPRSWRVRAGRVTHPGGNLRWARGTAPQTRVSFQVRSVVVGGGGSAPPRVPSTSSSTSGLNTANEIIAGHSARLWMYPREQRLATGVEFTNPAVHFLGEASDEKLAEQQWNAFRTIRFRR